MARNTRTGGVLERMVLPALEQGGYTWRAQVKTGAAAWVRRHFVDAVAEKDDLKYLVSVKWQQVSGTAEQKVPFEVICLAEAMAEDRVREGLRRARRRGLEAEAVLHRRWVEEIPKLCGRCRGGHARGVRQPEPTKGSSDGQDQTPAGGFQVPARPIPVAAAVHRTGATAGLRLVGRHPRDIPLQALGDLLENVTDTTYRVSEIFAAYNTCRSSGRWSRRSAGWSQITGTKCTRASWSMSSTCPSSMR